jgi:hypothetical protein
MEYIILILILGIMYSLWPYNFLRCLRDDTKVNWQGETIEPSPFVPNPDNEPYKIQEDEPCPLKPKKPKPTKRKTRKKTDKDTTKKKGSSTKTRKPRKKREKK